MRAHTLSDGFVDHRQTVRAAGETHLSFNRVSITKGSHEENSFRFFFVERWKKNTKDNGRSSEVCDNLSNQSLELFFRRVFRNGYFGR